MNATPEQEQVISHRDGAAIVLAGAGSGKTTALVTRTARMLSEGVSPDAMLLLTFSRKAANELRNRLIEMLPGDDSALRMRVNTFHAFGSRFVQVYPWLCERAQRCTVLDDTDQDRIVRGVAGEWFDLKDPIDKAVVGKIMSLYSLCKNEGWSASRSGDLRNIEDVLREHSNLRGDRIRRGLETLQGYERRTRELNVVDFDDLCLLPTRALMENPDVAEKLSRKFQYVTVDESQDTNRVQYAMVRAIARPHGNLLMCGDDDQVLYSWRGARVTNLQRFQKEFNATSYTMVRNFRSHRNIVEAAARLISWNEHRFDKKPFSGAIPGKPPRMLKCEQGTQMARAIAETIRNDIRAGIPPSEIAVLYRTNRLSRMLEGPLRALGIEYNVVGGSSIYESKEVRALMGAVRLIVNDKDVAALGALAEFTEGLAEAGLAKVAHTVREEKVSVWESFRKHGGRLAQTGERIRQQIEVLAAGDPAKAGEWMAKPYGFDLEGHYAKRKAKAANPAEVEAEGQRRVMNLLAFDQGTLGALERASKLMAPQGTATPGDYMTHLPDIERWSVLLEARIADRDQEGDGEKKNSSVTLSTIHRAKGLEWKHVYIAGWSDGLMPLTSSFEGVPAEGDELLGGGIEEERRLAYVALTRAKEICVMFHANDYAPFGPSGLQPSRFWKELCQSRSQAMKQIEEAERAEPPRQTTSSFMSASASMG